MINGFEEITAPLTPAEEQLLPLMLSGLRKKIGKTNAVKNKEIVAGLTSRGFKLTEARVRKIINHIRLNGLIPGLIATSHGYYISNDRTELANYIESLMGRELAIKQVREAMQEHLKNCILYSKNQ